MNSRKNMKKRAVVHDGKHKGEILVNQYFSFFHGLENCLVTA